MDKREIAAVLSEMATIMEIKGENPFKIRAYENAARAVEEMDDLEGRISAGTLTEIRGIGENLAEHITELFKTGKIKEYESLRKSVPEGIFDLLSIPGLGPKRVKVLYEKLHVKDIGGLELVCRAGNLRRLDGFGEKTETKILQGIAYLRRNLGQHLFSSALVAAVGIHEKIKRHPLVVRSEIAGSIRRKKEIIKDIDIVVASKKPKEVMDFFTTLPEVEKIESKGETKSSVILKSNISADLRVVTEREFPHALHHFTGSKEHNVNLRARAIRLGMKMNEYGLFKTGGGKEIPVPCQNEAEIFAKLGLSFIEPELREDTGEIEAAEGGKLPELVGEKDIRGILHVHTNYSDGANTIEELAAFAKKLGYSYLGICDHSQSAHYAGGLKPPDIKRQWKEIDALNKRLKDFVVLKGIESDILKDGSLDYPDEILAGFDFVVASVHSRFNMAEDEMTERLIAAVKNPHTTILGHPTGRLLLSREPYKVNMHRVIDAAAESGTAIELNANPYRLDIDWRLCPYAQSKGAKIAVCPDAHADRNMLDMMFGVGIARKGWLTKSDVVNTMSAEKFLKWCKSRKS